jgi:RNA polymerase sigma-70 factor, ECF subfamily
MRGHANRVAVVNLPDVDAALVRYLPDLRRLARRLTSQAALADDLVQDTCRRALEARAQLLRGADVRGWFFSILRNLYRDHLRRAAHEVPTDDLDERLCAPETERTPLWKEVSDAEVERALAAVPSIYRETYLLHVVKQRSYAEIGRQLGIPSGTVGTRVLRARLKLRRDLTRATNGDQRSAIGARSRSAA